MTTIAYKNGILVSDGLLTDDTGLIISEEFRKIKRIDKRTILLVSGNPKGFSIAEEAWNLYYTGNELNFSIEEEDFDAYIINAEEHEKLLYKYSAVDNEWIRLDLPDIFASGSGQKIALGAMAAGKSAEAAVKIACEYDVFSGGKIFKMRV